MKEGEILGFLGPNGAGKTTTLNMLSTLLRPSEGAAKVNGFDIEQEPDAVRRSIGYVFQESPSSNPFVRSVRIVLKNGGEIQNDLPRNKILSKVWTYPYKQSLSPPQIKDREEGT